MTSSAQQIGFGFLSPAVASHTFPEFIGSWNSHCWHEGEIQTVDGRTLVVKARLSDSVRDAVVAVVNGDEFEIERSAFNRWIFKGDTVAEVISAVAIGLKPALFTDYEKKSEEMRRESDRRNRIETKKILRDVHKRLEQERKQGGAE